MNSINLTQDYFQSENITEIISALINFQIAFQNSSLKKDAKNEHLKNGYVSLDNLLHVVRPLLSDNNLVVIQSLAGEYLTTVLYHNSGQFIGSNMPFHPMSATKVTNPLQEMGGGISYAKRYSLSAILQISVDVDNDGNDSKLSNKQLSKNKRKKVETMDQVYKIIEWLVEDISRIDTLEDKFEISESHLQFINIELQNRL